MSNWLDLVGDDSNVSMKSNDFAQCEVKRLTSKKTNKKNKKTCILALNRNKR